MNPLVILAQARIHFQLLLKVDSGLRQNDGAKRLCGR
jgi:hypothetical protein